MAIGLFMKRKTEESLNQLIECFAMQEQAYREDNYDKFMRKDMEFHSIFVSGSKNKKIELFVNTINDLIKILAFLDKSDKELVKKAFEQHKYVLEAVKRGDTAQAKKGIVEHIKWLKVYHSNKYYLF